MNQDKKFIKYWEKMYSKQNVFGTGPTKLALYAEEILKNNKFATIMEAGGGQGRDAIYFSQLGYEVHTCDISPQAVDFMKKIKNSMKLEKLNIFQHDFTKPFDSSLNSFDFVYSNLALQFCDITTLDMAFQNISKIMNKNSYFLFSTKKKGDKYYQHGKKIDDSAFEYNDIIRYFFGQDTLNNLLEKYFKIIKFDSESHTNIDSTVSVWWKILVQKE